MTAVQFGIKMALSHVLFDIAGKELNEINQNAALLARIASIALPTIFLVALLRSAPFWASPLLSSCGLLLGGVVGLLVIEPCLIHIGAWLGLPNCQIARDIRRAGI